MFKPLRDWILVEAITEDKFAFVGQPTEVEVVAVGPGKYLPSGLFIEPNVGVGARVLVSGCRGVPIETEGKEFYLVPEEDILGIEVVK